MSVDALTRDIDKLTDNFYRSENKAKVGVHLQLGGQVNRSGEYG